MMNARKLQGNYKRERRMTRNFYELFKNEWWAHFVGVLLHTDVPPIKQRHLTADQLQWAREHNGFWFKCPCVEDDHYAWRSYEDEGLSKSFSPVLTCSKTNRQWLVHAPDVVSTICSEEQIYLARLRLYPDIIQKIIAQRGISEETKKFLHDTHGITPEETDCVLAMGDTGVLIDMRR